MHAELGPLQTITLGRPEMHCLYSSNAEAQLQALPPQSWHLQRHMPPGRSLHLYGPDSKVPLPRNGPLNVWRVAWFSGPPGTLQKASFLSFLGFRGSLRHFLAVNQRCIWPLSLRGLQTLAFRSGVDGWGRPSLSVLIACRRVSERPSLGVALGFWGAGWALGGALAGWVWGCAGELGGFLEARAGIGVERRGVQGARPGKSLVGGPHGVVVVGLARGHAHVAGISGKELAWSGERCEDCTTDGKM